MIDWLKKFKYSVSPPVYTPYCVLHVTLPTPLPQVSNTTHLQGVVSHLISDEILRNFVHSV